MEKNKKENEHEINEVDATKGDEINKVDATKAVDDDDCIKWWQSTKQTLLINFGGELQDIKPFNISIVPDELRKENENAYKPKVLAMGPTYNGTRRDLLQMEVMKQCCLSILLHRSEETVGDETTVTPEQGSLEEFSKMIWSNDESIRLCYTEEISLDRTKLATTMLYDSWFMLELLISGSYESKKGLITYSEYLATTPVRKMEEALTDLMLLENQIPLALVINLSQKLFPKQFGHEITSTTTLNTFKDMALSLLSCSPPPHGDSNNSNIRCPVHVLDLVHSSIFLGREDDDDDEEVKPEENDQRLSLPMTDNNEEEPVDGGLNRCATRLHAAGVTIKPPDDQRENTKKPSPTISSFNFDIRFGNGTLEIPQLHITEATEPLWRNFIAWEHHKKKWYSNYWRNAPAELLIERGRDTFRCKCTWAALLFNGLICCASDAQLLKDKRVIVDHLNMSNRELVRFFRSITMGVDRGIVDYSSHKKMVAALNTCPASKKATEIPTIGWHYVSKIPEDLFYSLSNFLRRGYNFAATFLLVLTVVQTLYSVLSYHQKK